MSCSRAKLSSCRQFPLFCACDQVSITCSLLRVRALGCSNSYNSCDSPCLSLYEQCFSSGLNFWNVHRAPLVNYNVLFLQQHACHLYSQEPGSSYYSHRFFCLTFFAVDVATYSMRLLDSVLWSIL